ncbi:MAG: hypothetical protein RJA70_1482 [Pseudomonadota bacterium]|jgi:hypothetical protein
MNLLMPLVVGAMFVAYLLWSLKKKAQIQAGASGAFREFFQQTGFRVANLPAGAPIEEHARAASAAQGLMGGPEGQAWVRDCAGVPVTFFFKTVQGGHALYYWCRWSAPLAGALRVGLQIVDRRLLGASGKVDNFIENRSYQWQREFPYEVQAGDLELDQRFLFLGDQPALVGQVLGTPGLRELLLGCTQVDVTVNTAGVSFSDPFRENLTAGFGGGMGALAAGYDPKAMMAGMQSVHERVCWLVAELARACR